MEFGKLITLLTIRDLIEVKYLFGCAEEMIHCKESYLYYNRNRFFEISECTKENISNRDFFNKIAS